MTLREKVFRLMEQGKTPSQIGRVLRMEPEQVKRVLFEKWGEKYDED